MWSNRCGVDVEFEREIFSADFLLDEEK